MPIASPPTRRPVVAVVRLVFLVVLLVAAGCGSADGIDDEPVGRIGDEPRVADARFDGTFDIVEVITDGAVVVLEQRPMIEIEAQFGGLTVQPGCNTAFGSFSLDEEGVASFTVTGGTEVDCELLTDQETAILTTLESVDQWAETEDGFRFSGPSSSLSVAGPIG